MLHYDVALPNLGRLQDVISTNQRQNCDVAGYVIFHRPVMSYGYNTLTYLRHRCDVTRRRSDVADSSFAHWDL